MDTAAPSNRTATAQPENGEALQPRARTYALALLFAIYVLNFLDRQIVNILAEEIRNELHLRDWQIGAMTGLAFATLYSVLGFPIARMADRGDRPWIIAIAVLVWSGFTAVCGLARSFPQFALARMGVGVGEAGCTPPAHSLISDYVPRAKRASALAFYSMGGPVGTLLGLIIGGLVADRCGWRAAFLVVAAPGVLLGILAAIILPEPRRGRRGEASRTPPSSLGATLREIGSCRTYWLFTAATTMMALVSYGHAAFLASFYMRNHAAGLAELAQALSLGSVGVLGVATGLITGIGGIFGALIGGRLADRAAARTPKGYATLAAMAAFWSAPPYIAAMLTPSTVAALAWLFPAYFAFNLALGAMYAVPQSVVSPQNRAMATALLLFCTNLLGLGLGPLLAGAVSDLLQIQFHQTPGDAIRWVQVVDSLFGLVAAALYWSARPHIERDIKS